MSFLQDFMLYNEGNECPRPYVLWTGYGLLSATMGRRCFLDLGYFWVGTDIYILIIGDTGTKKTAALDLGVDLLQKAVPDVVLAGDNETYQGIIAYMHSDNSTRFYKDVKGNDVPYKPYCIMAAELMDYIQLNPIAMVTFLTGIYGRKAYRYRLKNEEHLLENPYVMMCACSTPNWLTDQIKAKQFAEGYGRRCIVICGEKSKRKKPELKPEYTAAAERCVLRLKAIQHIAGPMLPTKEAETWFWDWYVHLKDPDDYFIKNWYSTLNINLLKVAALTSLSERDDRVITLDHMKLSLGLLMDVQKNLPMVTARLGRSELIHPALHILEVLKNHQGRYPEKQLKMDTLKDFKDPREQWQVMEWLKSTDQIALASGTDGKIYVILKPQNPKPL